MTEKTWRAALYARLSREDGDKAESDSIANQRALLEQYLAGHPELNFAGLYIDDGYTGTNFDRPAFQRLLKDIDGGRVDCVMVKDLSRFGRDYLDVGRYLERWFPRRGVRFLALGDQIDSEQGPYDMLLPVKNLFNEQYARDISQKVRGAMAAKQRRGEFIGAFASYGYRKDPENHNKLCLDPPAAQVVRRIFSLFEGGMGQLAVAQLLNREKIPCPSEYKRLMGEKYHNGQKLDSTTYWTYATIHRMLQNPMYAGNMIQGRAPRRALHGRAQLLPPDQWAVVEGTHEAIIPPEQWARVQGLLEKRGRTPSFDGQVGLFAGFLRCGDCGRAMAKFRRRGEEYYCCGSYKRYGAAVCSRHQVSRRWLEARLRQDLNGALADAACVETLAKQAGFPPPRHPGGTSREELQKALDRLFRRKKEAYEDFREGLLSRADFLRYQSAYTAQEEGLAAQLQSWRQAQAAAERESPWVEDLLEKGRFPALDRRALAALVAGVAVFEDRVEVTYTFGRPPSLPHTMGGKGACHEENTVHGAGPAAGGLPAAPRGRRSL